jgi:hypothetical protein
MRSTELGFRANNPLKPVPAHLLQHDCSVIEWRQKCGSLM